MHAYADHAICTYFMTYNGVTERTSNGDLGKMYAVTIVSNAAYCYQAQAQAPVQYECVSHRASWQ
eukprot:12287-Heterococcus_DN1.PRE.9